MALSAYGVSFAAKQRCFDLHPAVLCIRCELLYQRRRKAVIVAYLVQIHQHIVG